MNNAPTTNETDVDDLVDAALKANRGALLAVGVMFVSLLALAGSAMKMIDEWSTKTTTPQNFWAGMILAGLIIFVLSLSLAQLFLRTIDDSTKTLVNAYGPDIERQAPNASDRKRIYEVCRRGGQPALRWRSEDSGGYAYYILTTGELVKQQANERPNMLGQTATCEVELIGTTKRP